MLFTRPKGLDTDDAEKIFLLARNTSGAAISAGVPVFWEVDAQTDGVSVSHASASEQFNLFAGITRVAMEDDEFALIQVYGQHETAFVSCASAGNEVGLALIPVAGSLFLTDSTSSARADWNFVNLMETVGAAAGNSAVLTHRVFIRAL